MRTYKPTAVLIAVLGLSTFGHAKNKDGVDTVKKAVERSTLNQPGTKPFHLKAVLAPSRDSDRESNQTGQVESFESARTYFERGRRVGFPAAGNGPPYSLHAVFQAKVKGKVEEGQYVDTWQSDGEWRREASIGKSRYVRARHGEKYYRLAEGPDAELLRLVLRVMEPIPAIDTFMESDWRIKRDTVDGVRTLRVLTGYEHPDGTLDPEQARGFWFDDAGKLVKTYFAGIETRRSHFENFGGAEVARQIRVLSNGAVGMLIQVTDLSPAGTVAADAFQLHGHEWTRRFTDEVR